jgi:hypothetical protein
MDPFHFACPHCSAPLRVREKLYVGRHVDCPECSQSLKIVESRDGMGVERLERRIVGGPPAGAQPNPAAPAAAGTDEPIRQSGKQQRRFVCLAAAIVLVGIICGTTLRFKSGGHGRPDAPRDPAVVTDGVAQPDAAGSEEPAADPPQNDQPPRSEVDQRLSKIGGMLNEFEEAEGSFPSGTVPISGIAPENRLSWMAQLAANTQAGSAPEPVWDQPWNAPQNEPFVRRRLSLFQNPAISQLTGADGFPASHFAGVAGVGADAARLDRRSARAGIFGFDRRTRLEDIRDGAANTLLVLGVRDQLGSWGASGPATVRGLAREPYVNGPDGFGTGSPDAMSALMADGRVISISAQIDPRIMRRMAAMADGFSLEESEPGEPGDRPSLLSGDPIADDDGDDPPDERDIADSRPLEPEFVPEPAVPAPRKIDLAQSLKQPIARFDQPPSKPLAEVLTGVAEMAGAQIAYDREELGPAAAQLAEPVALKLEHTTVGEILTGLLRPAGLAYRVEGDHLRLVPRPQ